MLVSLAFRRFVQQLNSFPVRWRSRRVRSRRWDVAVPVAAHVDLMEARELLSNIVVNSAAGGQNYAATVTTSQLDSTTTAVTLRDAINAANNSLGADTISFDSGVFAPNVSTTIILTGGTPLQFKDTSGATTVHGPSAAQVTVSGGNLSTVFLVNVGVTAAIDGLTITGGAGSIDLGGGSKGGGGLYNNGRLTLQNAVIAANAAGNFGGGFYNSSTGTVTVVASTITGNSGQFGGGFFNGGTATITDSTISGNSVTSNGGGFYNQATTTLTGSTLANNTAGANGGGFFSNNTVTLVNDTIAGNSAGSSGGGFINLRIATVIDSTIAGNFASQGGGIYNTGTNVTLSGTILARNTVSSSNSTPRDWGGLAANSASSYSLIGDGTGSGLTNGTNHNLVGTAASPVNPLLAALGDYGGPTWTMALLPGSPAINAGFNFTNPATGLPIGADQRGTGFNRISLGAADIGAFEIQSHPPSVPTVGSLTTTNKTPTIGGAWDVVNAVVLQVTISDNTASYVATYTLGSSSQLSTSGGTWSLDLAGTTPLAVGTYHVSVHTVNDIGESADSAVGSLVINAAPPIVAALSPQSANIGVPVNISAAVTGGDTVGLTALVDWGDVTTTAGTIASVNGVLTVSASHAYASPGVFNVQLTATNAFALSATSATTAAIVSTPPVVQALSPRSADVGQPVNISASITGGDTVGLIATIDWGDGTTSAGTIATVNGVLTAAASHAYASAGTFNVRLTVTNLYSATSTVATTATIATASRVADLQITAGKNVRIVATNLNATYDFEVKFVSGGVQLIGATGTTFNGASTLFIANAQSISGQLGHGNDRVSITGTGKHVTLALGEGANDLTLRNFRGDTVQISSGGALSMHVFNSSLCHLLVIGSHSAADLFQASGLNVCGETKLLLGDGANKVQIDDSHFRNFKLRSSGDGTVVEIEAGSANGNDTHFDGTVKLALGDRARIVISPLASSDRTAFRGKLCIFADSPEVVTNGGNVVISHRITTSPRHHSRCR